MARFDGKSTKQIATSMKITELSGVMTGAHEDAKVTIMKFKKPEDLLKSVYSEMLREKEVGEAMYEHLEPMWQMNAALREAAEEILTNPEITDKQAALRESVAGYINSVLQLFNKPMEADDMAQENQELEQMRSDLQKAQENADKLQADVERLGKLAKMTDASKAHYESLTGEDAEDFLKLSPEDQEATVKLTKSEDETYETAGGQTISKSEMGASFDIIKSQDIEMRKMQEQQAFAKAREEVGQNIPNVPGEQIAKTKAWQALQGLPAEQREYFETTLKAANELWKGRKAPAGEQGGEELDADGKLEKLAKEYASEHGVTMAKAHAEVLKTEDGQKLYAEMEA